MAYSEEEARTLVIEAGHRLLESGLIARTWGNISARISDTEFIITPSGRAYDTLQPGELVKCKIADCSYEGDIKPSSEKGVHADGYRLRPECDFIIHTHQFYATVISVPGEDIRSPHIPCAAYGMPSTGRLRKAVAAAVETNPSAKAVLMRRHGSLCLGNDCEDAFRVAEELEETCRKIYLETCGKFDGRELETVAAKGKTLYPAIDDLVQIAGTSVKCVDASADEKTRAKALKGRNALLVKGGDPVCTGPDAEAVLMLLKKGCAAAIYSGSLKGMNPVDALLQRTIYLKKYSKQKK